MNYTLIKIAPSDEEEYHQPQLCRPSHFIKTDAFTVLPPLSPQIPGPPPTPSPYRILPPIVSRKRPSFVILQEVGSRPPSRDPSPSGRVSPFRGCGFKPPSREPSPARGAVNETTKDDATHQSRSRLPVALRTPTRRKPSKSASPLRAKISGIPRPLNRRTSCSPNRVNEILATIDKAAQRKSPLKSSENLLHRRPVSESDLKSALRKPAANARPPPKPLPPRKPAIPTERASKPCSPDKKCPSSVCSSPSKRTPLSKLNECKKGNEGTGVKKIADSKPKPIPKSPNRISTKSKENLSPCSKIPSPAKTPRPIVKSTRPPRTPKTAAKASPNKSPCRSACKSDVKNKISPDNKPREKEKDTKDLPAKEDQPKAKEVTCEKPPPCKRNVSKKALTTSNLLNALKKTAEERKIDGEGKCHSGEKSEKKDLPHTDTSRSLPITIGTPNMTDSSMTLIRTTTEPALAPVQPDLITEIRSAINEAKNAEEPPCVKQEAKLVGAADATPAAPLATAEETTATNIVDPPKPESPAKQMKPNSPRPAHIIAVTKIEEPKHELTSAVVEIKQEADGEVLSANSSSIQSENRNGISKSSWLNENQPTELMRKPSVKKLRENPSTECLMPTPKKTSAWNRIRSKCPRCWRKSETHPVQISTITNGNESAAGVSRNESCLGKYFCYFCYKRKLKKREAASNANLRKCGAEPRCFKFKNDFKNVFGKMSCRKKKAAIGSAASSSESGVACEESAPAAKAGGCCGSCKNGLLKCFGVVCCANSAFCVKMRSKCTKWGSCCKRCYCCKERKKTVITEPERRRSILVPRRKKWTRVLTDFPKLDSSFVEHNSVMRGAIPLLPVPLAWICLILNVFLPGFGTLSSGIFCLCVGKPRFSINDSILSRFGAFLVNLLVAGSQFFTVLFCLVGWGWSIWWGVIMLKMAKKNKRIILAEQGPNAAHVTPVVDQNRDFEKGTAT